MLTNFRILERKIQLPTKVVNAQTDFKQKVTFKTQYKMQINTETNFPFTRPIVNNINN